MDTKRIVLETIISLIFINSVASKNCKSPRLCKENTRLCFECSLEPGTIYCSLFYRENNTYIQLKTQDDFTYENEVCSVALSFERVLDIGEKRYEIHHMAQNSTTQPEDLDRDFSSFRIEPKAPDITVHGFPLNNKSVILERRHQYRARCESVDRFLVTMTCPGNITSQGDSIVNVVFKLDIHNKRQICSCKLNLFGATTQKGEDVTVYLSRTVILKPTYDLKIVEEPTDGVGDMVVLCSGFSVSMDFPHIDKGLVFQIGLSRMLYQPGPDNTFEEIARYSTLDDRFYKGSSVQQPVDETTLTGSGGRDAYNNSINNVNTAAIRWSIPKVSNSSYNVYRCSFRYNQPEVPGYDYIGRGSWYHFSQRAILEVSDVKDGSEDPDVKDDTTTTRKPPSKKENKGLFGLLLPVTPLTMALYTGLGLMVISLVWCIAVGFYKKEINQPIKLKEELALSHEYTVTVTTTDTSAASDSLFLSDMSRTTQGTDSSDSPRDS